MATNKSRLKAILEAMRDKIPSPQSVSKTKKHRSSAEDNVTIQQSELYKSWRYVLLPLVISGLISLQRLSRTGKSTTTTAQQLFCSVEAAEWLDINTLHQTWFSVNY